MRRSIRLTEEELHRLIGRKIMEALEHNVDLDYSPAIGNKKRGPGKHTMDKMNKRRNKRMDELRGPGIDTMAKVALEFAAQGKDGYEFARYVGEKYGVSDDDALKAWNRMLDGAHEQYYDTKRAYNNGFLYESIGLGGEREGLYDVELSLEDYRQVIPIDDSIPSDEELFADWLEEMEMPESVCVRFHINVTEDFGDRDTPPDASAELKDWEIDDDRLDGFPTTLMMYIEKAVENHMAELDPDVLINYILD